MIGNPAVPSVSTVATAGTWRPTEVQETLLEAALGDGAPAEAAFSRWVATTGVDDVDAGSLRILALVARRFEQRGITTPWSALLRGILRRSWYENQVVLHTTLPAVDVLHAAGIDVAVLKGGSLGVFTYPGIGSRPMDDLDVLVPEDRATDALGALLDAGWELGDEGVPGALRRGEVPDAFRRIRHSAPLYGPGGGEIDLHWHATYAWCWPGADRGLWASSRPVELRGRRVRALAPADELVVACVHGLRPNAVPPIRWVADAVVVMQSEPVAWDALVDRARELRVSPHLVLAFDYLRNRFDAPVPDRVVHALRSQRQGYFERRWFSARLDDRPTRTIASHYGGYLRGARADTGFRRYAGGLPEHLVYLLGCDAAADLPGEVGRRATARLRRHRRGSPAS